VFHAFTTGDETHSRQRGKDGSNWLAWCSCGRMREVRGSASHAGNLWRQHVNAEATVLGVTPIRLEQAPRKLLRSSRLRDRLGSLATMPALNVKGFMDSSYSGGVMYGAKCRACPGLAPKQLMELDELRQWWQEHSATAFHKNRMLRPDLVPRAVESQRAALNGLR